MYMNRWGITAEKNKEEKQTNKKGKIQKGLNGKSKTEKYHK